jgi:wyosine [tRNA(Phe)-imidazoG37] synthetase (radical SAM superfamily)
MTSAFHDFCHHKLKKHLEEHPFEKAIYDTMVVSCIILSLETFENIWHFMSLIVWKFLELKTYIFVHANSTLKYLSLGHDEVFCVSKSVDEKFGHAWQ